MTVDGPSIGRRIRAYRQVGDLSLNALSERAKVSKGYLSQLENGSASNPSIDTLSRIASALQLSVEELVSDPRPAGQESRRMPKGLADFVAEREAQDGIYYRGRQARTAADWAFIYETIVRTIK
jgi:transcriptional regulator with XRE-family HTH domain